MEMNGISQHGYVILAFFRQGLALTLAVNIFALPLTLYIFHQFPVMGIIYNFFFPFLVTGSLSLLILGMLFSPFPLLPDLLHTLNNSYTQTILKFTYQMPNHIDRYITLDDLPTTVLLLWLGWMFSGIYHFKRILKNGKARNF